MDELFETKMEKCRYQFSLPDKDDAGNFKVTHLCKKDGMGIDGVETTEEKCEGCEFFKSKFIEYPITVNSIDTSPIEYNYALFNEVGSLVKIRPCAEEYNNKTYLGVLLGDLPVSHRVTFKESEGVLSVKDTSNPAIYVFELKKIIFGYESWWGVIPNLDKENLQDISDEDINNTWYVKIMREMSGVKDNAKNTTKSLDCISKDDCVSEGYLQNWYIDSVDETSNPKWTEEHIAELCQDFYIIPKEEK